MSNWQEKIWPSILSKYEMHNFHHAVEILSQAYPSELQEIMLALEGFTLSKSDILAGGGNESAIPKKLSAFLHPQNWQEMKITADLLVKLHQRNAAETSEVLIKDFIDGHNIDYVKNRVALDME